MDYLDYIKILNLSVLDQDWELIFIDPKLVVSTIPTLSFSLLLQLNYLMTLFLSVDSTLVVLPVLVNTN